MPYINQKFRDEIDWSISHLADDIDDIVQNSPLVKTPAGIMNYTITELINSIYFNRDGVVSYDKINEIIGILECCKLEFYRRVALQYENKKISENGDVSYSEIIKETIDNQEQ